MPFIGPLGSDSVSNYTVIMDVLVPSNSTGRAMFFDIFDRWGNLIFSSPPTPGAGMPEMLSLEGMVNGTSFNLDSTMPLSPGKWNRIALVVGNGELRGLISGATVTVYELTVYVNGELGGSTQIIGTSPAITVAAGLAVFSSPDGTDGELYVSGLQFHPVAFTPEMMASIGSPENGQIPANDPSMSVMSPVLLVTMSPTGINLKWDDDNGGAFDLEETSNLGNGEWMESMPPFIEEADVSGKITFTATVNPSLGGQVKFYRLKHNYIGTVTLIR
jgi:hypothetical protein